MPNSDSNLFDFIKAIFAEWRKDRAAQLAAALSFYAILSLSPLLVIIVSVVGLVVGQQAARSQFMQSAQQLIGPEGTQALQTLFENANGSSSGTIATIIGAVTLVITASAVFAQLQTALNIIWNVEPPARSNLKAILQVARKRVFSFAMVILIGVLLLASLVASTLVSSLDSIIDNLLPNTLALSRILNFVVSFLLITVLFALIFRVLPDVSITWRSVWLGAAVTSLLFGLGQVAIGLYLGQSSLASPYGAAGSFVVLLVWIYYSTQIFFLGAEFTKVYAEWYGEKSE
jgi:membrane protein